MADPRIDFLKKHLGVSDGVANATVNGGWPDVDSPDDKKSAATKKNAKSYKHFKQDHEAEVKAAVGPCDKLEEGVKEWHADSHPETKNVDGSPKTFYHGTGEDIEHFNHVADGVDGIYFSSSPHIANEYADWRHHDWEGNGNVLPVHLHMKNPKVLDYKGEGFDASHFQMTVDHAKEHGHDGVIVKNVDDSWKGKGPMADTAIVFHPHQIKSVFAKHFNPKSTSISESREEFLSKYGTADHIHNLIDGAIKDPDNNFYPAVVRNPVFNREHHEKMLHSGFNHILNHAIHSPHMTTEDLSSIVHKPHRVDPYIMNNVVMHPKTSIADLKHVAANYPMHGTVTPGEADKIRANAINYVHKRDRTAWTHPELDAIMEKSTKGEDRHWTNSTRTFDAAQITKHYLDVDQKRATKKPVSDEEGTIWGVKESVETPSDWASYWLENKQIWVPTSHIIADAHETNEGLSAMGEEFVLFEDGVVHRWNNIALGSHLQLSQSVHNHYKDAGVNHYPYLHNGKALMDRIGSIAHYNAHSRPFNDTLHRNFHGHPMQVWDKQHGDVIKTMDHIFDNGPKTTSALNTLSGLKQSPQDLIDHVKGMGHSVGDHIYMHLPAFTSTSTMVSMARAFTKRFNTKFNPDQSVRHADHHLFHIHVPAGNKMIGMMAHPDLENGSEHELILPRDTILKVHTTPAKYNVEGRTLHVWHSEVAGTNRTPLKTP